MLLSNVGDVSKFDQSGKSTTPKVWRKKRGLVTATIERERERSILKSHGQGFENSVIMNRAVSGFADVGVRAEHYEPRSPIHLVHQVCWATIADALRLFRP